MHIIYYHLRVLFGNRNGNRGTPEIEKKYHYS